MSLHYYSQQKCSCNLSHHSHQHHHDNQRNQFCTCDTHSNYDKRTRNNLCEVTRTPIRHHHHGTHRVLNPLPKRHGGSLIDTLCHDRVHHQHHHSEHNHGKGIQIHPNDNGSGQKSVIIFM
ncbi:hypothetical protein ACOI1C_08230 [Bacillus sp. DJP31]|uniref:hypothetical protein n=1 Tax=Bacillus sp. DJP31 TaxID=3409789 RepID=UPI003BB7918C